MTKLASSRVVAMALSIAALSGCSSLSQNSAPVVVGGNDSIAPGRGYNDAVYPDRIGRHFYAATGVGASRLEPDTSEVPGVDVNDRVNAGGQVTLGMDLSRQMAIELHSADLGSAGLSPTGRINYHLHGMSALLYAGKQRHNYRRNGLTGYGRIGLGLLQNSPVGEVDFVKDNATHVLFGAGLEYMTKMGLGVRAEAISYEQDVQYGQLALVYRTGKRRSKKPVEIVKAPAPVPVPAVVPAVKVVEPIPEPVVVAPSVCDQFNGVLDGVNFHSDSAELTDQGLRVLDQAAQKLQTCDDVMIRVSAHTDSVGADAYNQSLSERRARSVVQRLSQRGIDMSRMSAKAFGETQPIDTNATPEGRRRNRRVELYAQ